VAVVDEAGVEVPTGTVGDVRVSGPGIMDGCWNESAMSRKTLRQGWVLTGDVGRYDEDGYLWFMGRRKDIIVYDGHKIAPLAVEAVLAEHPAVLQACVIGVPDADDGEVPHAYVIPEPGATADPGELAILHDAPRAATVRALTDVEVYACLSSFGGGERRRRAPGSARSWRVLRRGTARANFPPGADWFILGGPIRGLGTHRSPRIDRASFDVRPAPSRRRPPTAFRGFAPCRPARPSTALLVSPGGPSCRWPPPPLPFLTLDLGDRP